MPGTVLYASTVPISGGPEKLTELNEKRREVDKKFGLLPYIVSGPFSVNDKLSLDNAVPVIGAAIHVLLWIAGFVFDGLLGAKLTAHDHADHTPTASDNYYYTLWAYSLGSYIVAFVGLCALILTHWMSGGIPEGRAPPYLVTIVTGGCVVGSVLSFLLLQATPSTLYKHLEPNKTSDETLTFEREYIHFAIWVFVIKSYIASFVVNNQFWARAGN